MDDIVKPLVSIACTEDGDYYVYQVKDLIDVNGLGKGLTKRREKDNLFVTKIISELASMAYEIVRDITLPEEVIKLQEQDEDESESDEEEREIIKMMK